MFVCVSWLMWICDCFSLPPKLGSTGVQAIMVWHQLNKVIKYADFAVRSSSPRLQEQVIVNLNNLKCNVFFFFWEFRNSLLVLLIYQIQGAHGVLVSSGLTARWFKSPLGEVCMFSLSIWRFCPSTPSSSNVLKTFFID